MFVYILKCYDNSYYTGVTNNIERRFQEHQEGINENCYTFSRRPLKFVYFEKFDDPIKAIEFEKRIKNWSRAKKEALINQNWTHLHELAKCLNSTSHVLKSPSTSLGMTDVY